ncbi:hypothetical protein [Pseudomonas amygdali]|uniref:Uncharacterized protein n=2 Tax=Pseudomonas amygdali pv. lachrymans TaxID=53707 RepID=A0ABR5KR56_PSEAV|nr:hypothetical protein [Pseudomonas amygdali]AXH59596.1 hypothetical protein PLA107_030700 [Pseudomonas amygdali pv. lachrymans str. M301315]KPC17025.1 Uncharacterized protein AC499_0227 [Pseudomonas amygdali pv. lachrymans]KPC17984.1 Uncharacterized protein AC499_1186 [Pseudomonas amygdali pv. lachrymans]
MSATPIVIFGLGALGVFVIVQIYRTIAMVRGSNSRKQRFDKVMQAEQARMEVLKRQADEAAQSVPTSILDDTLPELELDQKAAA